MKRFKSILVVCQEDCQPELAVERARILAKQNGARVTLVDVVSPREPEMAEVMSDVIDRTSLELTSQFSQRHQARLSEYGQPLQDAGIETRVQVLSGVVFIEIVRAVLRDGHDLVIKAIDPNLHFRGQQIFSGLDMHLMRKCPCPLWVLKDEIDQKDLHVLAAVDPDCSDTDRQGLNRLVMDLSSSVCPADTGQLHVVHAWTLEEERALLNSKNGQATAEEIEQIRHKKHALRTQTLDRLISHYPAEDPRRHIHLVEGEAAEVVPDLAANNEIGLVVMGTVRRTDVPGMFMGDTAEMILNRVNCSVLAVKPCSFRTPVELDDSTIRHSAAPQKVVRAV